MEILQHAVTIRVDDPLNFEAMAGSEGLVGFLNEKYANKCVANCFCVGVTRVLRRGPVRIVPFDDSGHGLIDIAFELRGKRYRLNQILSDVRVSDVSRSVRGMYRNEAGVQVLGMRPVEDGILRAAQLDSIVPCRVISAVFHEGQPLASVVAAPCTCAQENLPWIVAPHDDGDDGLIAEWLRLVRTELERRAAKTDAEKKLILFFEWFYYAYKLPPAAVKKTQKIVTPGFPDWEGHLSVPPPVGFETLNVLRVASRGDALDMTPPGTVVVREMSAPRTAPVFHRHVGADALDAASRGLLDEQPLSVILVRILEDVWMSLVAVREMSETISGETLSLKGNRVLWNKIGQARAPLPAGRPPAADLAALAAPAALAALATSAADSAVDSAADSAVDSAAADSA